MNTKQIFKDLANIPSPSGNEAAVLSYVSQFFVSNKIKHKRAKDSFGNLYIYLSDPGKDSFFFCFHADTVFDTTGLVPEEKNGYIHSQGKTILGADNKASLAAFLGAVSDHHREYGAPPSCTLLVTRCEEIGLIGARNVDTTLLPSKEGYVFDTATPLGTFVQRSPKSVVYKLTVSQDAKHIKDLGLRDPLIFAASSMLKSFSRKNTKTYKHVVGKISGGSSLNTSIGEITFEGNMRSYSPKLITKFQQSLLAQCSQLQSGVNAEVEYKSAGDGYVISKSSRLFRRYIKSCHSLGLRVSPISTWGGSDANALSEKGLSVMNCGDGCEAIHTTRERVSIKSLEQLTQIIGKLFA